MYLNVFICLMYLYASVVYALQFSHLLRIQRRLGSQKFPIIDQSFYPNYSEMINNLWVSTV